MHDAGKVAPPPAARSHSLVLPIGGLKCSEKVDITNDRWTGIATATYGHNIEQSEPHGLGELAC